jgi:hypothetical protein
MSETDIPNRFGPATKWVTAGIFLFVEVLGISDSAHAKDWVWTAIYSALFVVTFVIAVKWTQISEALTRWRQKVAWTLVALGFMGALALGIAIGGLLLRGGPLASVGAQSTGRITWNFDQTARGEGYFLNMNRLNNEEIRVIGFGGHGKNTSNDPITEFSGFIRSDLTNEQKPIYILAQVSDPQPGQPVPFPPVTMLPTLPEDTFGIPGLADFDITTHNKAVIETGKDGLPLTQFLKEWGAFTVVLKYDGTTVERHFTRTEVDGQVALLEKSMNPQGTIGPRVTRKQTAPPVEGLMFLAPAQLAPPAPAPILPAPAQGQNPPKEQP